MKIFLVLLLVFAASAAYGEIYTWKDARGTAFYANSLNDIPARYLKKARVLDVATGKLGGLATAQPPTQPPAQVASPAAFGQPGQSPGVTASPAPPPLPLPAPAAPPAAAAGVIQPQPQPQPQVQQVRVRKKMERRHERAPEEE